MNRSRILHVIPRFTGAGPERSLLASIAFAPETAVRFDHVVAVLDVPVAASMFLAARRLGVEVLVQPDLARMEEEADRADMIVVHFWNHPLLLSLLGRVDLGETRVVVWSMVLGLHPPQVLAEQVGDFADVLVVTTERSLDSEAARASARVFMVPGIADMGRLAEWRAIPHGGVHVGYLGLVSPLKMHSRFAEMSAKVKDPSVQFHVYGAGGGEDRILSRVREVGIEDRFHLNGYADDIAAALSTIDIFGYPLCADTYATSEKALQEAMWVGIPPVVFPHGGVIDLVDDGLTGLIVQDEDEYAEAIDRLAGDAVLRSELGERARRVGRERFDPRTLAASWSEVLVAALDSPPRSRPPLFGGLEGAELFVAANGAEATPFATSLAIGGGEEAVDGVIAASSPLVVSGDGGIAHFASVWPEDPALRHWSRLVS